MQRLDGERHPGTSGVVEQRADAVLHHCCAPLRDRAMAGSGPRELRQTADDENKARRAERDRLVDRAAVVVPRFLRPDRVARKHASAAISGQRQPGRLHGLDRAVEPDRRDLIAPRRYRARSPLCACVDDREKITLLAQCRGVDRQPAVIGREVAQARLPHPSTPRAASTVRIRWTANSGSRSRPAASASRNSSARCKVERALSWPPTMVKWF